MPRNQQTSPRLQNLIAAIRERSGMSFRDVARICKLNPTTIWKLEGGYRIKAKTLRKILTDGFGIAEGSKEWDDAIAAWASDYAQHDFSADELQRKMNRVAERMDGEVADWATAMAHAGRRLSSAERDALLRVAQTKDAAEVIERLVPLILK